MTFLVVVFVILTAITIKLIEVFHAQILLLIFVFLDGGHWEGGLDFLWWLDVPSPWTLILYGPARQPGYDVLKMHIEKSALHAVTSGLNNTLD